MLPVISSEEMRAIDRRIIDEIGVPSLTLMESAANGALTSIQDWLSVTHPYVLIFAGIGNNGGDGMALARLLHERGIGFQLIIGGNKVKFTPEAKWQYGELMSRGLDALIAELAAIQRIARTPTIIIDALLGTGSKGTPREPILSAVKKINQLARETNAHVLSIDIPTGLDADTGEFAEGSVVVAERTVTIGANKMGFYQREAPCITGEISVASLGVPLPNLENARIHLVERSDVRSNYPRRKRTASKFDFGRVLTVCGSRGMTGAAIMGGTSALRSGCGLVTVAIPKSQQPIVARAMPELMTFPISETEDGAPSEAAFDELQPQIEKADVLLIGSGIVPAKETAALLLRLLKEVDRPILADAGTIVALRDHLDILKSRKSPTILTPHAGELAQMIGSDWKTVTNDRLTIAQKFAEQFHVTLVMKGAPTYTVSPNGEVIINATGGLGLATAGSGDVLAGMIAGTLAQMTDAPFDASWIAVYLHGLAADSAEREMTSIAMTATDSIRHLPDAYKAVGLG